MSPCVVPRLDTAYEEVAAVFISDTPLLMALLLKLESEPECIGVQPVSSADLRTIWRFRGVCGPPRRLIDGRVCKIIGPFDIPKLI